MIRVILILLFFLTQTNKAFSLIEVDITRGNLDPLPIAVSPLHVDPNSKTGSIGGSGAISAFIFLSSLACRADCKSEICCCIILNLSTS